MNKNEIYETLEKLTNIVSPSGHEDEIRNTIIELLKPYADEIWVDSLGNVIAVKKGSGEGRLMIAAHMDEIGLMINHITKTGFLKFTPIGGWNPVILPGQRVLIKTKRREYVRGVIGMKPPHIMKPEEAKQAPQIEDLFIDIGASSREEAEKLGITVGSVAVIERNIAKLSENVVTGRAFDDKIGVAVMIEAFKNLEKPKVDVYAVATVMEEVGLKGARVAAYSITPHVGLALDVTIAADIPGVDESKQITKLGKGPAIKVMDGRSGSGLIAHPAIKDTLIQLAEKHNIPYQLEVLTGGTTDATIIQLTKEGVPTGALSVPTRYIHSPVEVLNLEDALNTAKLTKLFAEYIDMEWINKYLKRKIK
ncbi:peptidase M42 family protein [Staphylothermus marinus F1]|uniref:Peptidase M42 family protein n=1 Tax=Staphylothermus marinus (strain ATCC 43588 / DSM 3639 / JCM 9404 / F1) TaxID=399550 RepID=A3DKL0_STAMF|nr:M42 family metallopeptidase [Staphylothermus marinus]ABN69170.1 peptidase M42 family protein [Staphylothermus marinus F1]